MESDITESPLLYKTWLWFEANKKQVITGLVVIVVLGIAAGIYFYGRMQKNVSASEALAELTTRGPESGQVQPEAFAKIATDYAGTSAAGRALLVAGARYFEASNYTQAQAQFEKFLSQYRDSDFTGQALFGIAASLDAQGKSADAIKAYKDIIEHHSTDEVAPQAMLALGQIYEAQGDFELARDTYGQLERMGPGSLGSTAAMRLQDLESKHPELALPKVSQTNAPTLNLKP
ncbi:MAG TPA: tetratricopeptide repeat protein [Verrucomicrobiae bacterium]|jgi:TolA-binding protein|nr:tetratricopeptide repeat protein [Verrucomicrobiae bacterium]